MFQVFFYRSRLLLLISVFHALHDAQNISYIIKGKRIPDILPYKHSNASSYTEIVKCWQNSLALSWWAVTLAVAVLSAGMKLSLSCICLEMKKFSVCISSPSLIHVGNERWWILILLTAAYSSIVSFACFRSATFSVPSGLLSLVLDLACKITSCAISAVSFSPPNCSPSIS